MHVAPALQEPGNARLFSLSNVIVISEGYCRVLPATRWAGHRETLTAEQVGSSCKQYQIGGGGGGGGGSGDGGGDGAVSPREQVKTVDRLEPTASERTATIGKKVVVGASWYWPGRRGLGGCMHLT